MKDKIQQRILELRTELGEYNVEELNERIQETQSKLDGILAERNSLIDEYNAINDEIVYWLDVLDKVDELIPSGEEDVEELPKEEGSEEE